MGSTGDYILADTAISSTYRGYRRQALYALWRLTTDEDSTIRTYRPEGAEDLAVFGSGGRLLEAVQVKDYTSPLAISDFKPASPDGFFARTHRRLREHPDCKVSLASFGPLGPELKAAIAKDGTQRTAVASKLTNKNPTLSANEYQQVLAYLNGRVTHPREAQLHEDIMRALAPTIAGAHGTTALELLLFWIFDASERQRPISRSAVLAQIERVGAYLSALRDHASEWHVSVRPLTDETVSPADRDALRASYRRGAQATWEHILTDVDSVRTDRLREMHEKLQHHSAVVIRGASGQGKSSLALRYVHDYSASGLRFYVRFVDGRTHAVRIANALRNHIAALGLRALVLLDIAPSDSGWGELLKDLAEAGISVVVAVREEDLHRAGAVFGDVPLGEVALDSISREEARGIYESLTRETSITPRLDFEDAWAHFTSLDSGPLLEFTHIVTEGETLASKIDSQVRRLQQEASSPHSSTFTERHLRLLALASIANESECRVDLTALCASVGMDPLTRPLTILEDEYLLRATTAGTQTVVAPLHALRSQAIVRALLHDCPENWIDLAIQCFPLIVDADVERFLLNAFSRRPEHSKALESYLHTFAPRTWTHAVAIGRALLWEGVNRYEDENHAALASAVSEFGGAWWLTCDLNLASDSRAADLLRTTLGEIFKKNEADLPTTLLTDKARAFEPFVRWVSSVSAPASTPRSNSDWVALGDLAFWIGRRRIDGPVANAIRDCVPTSIPDQLSIQDLSHFVSGRYAIGDPDFVAWMRRWASSLSSQFVRDTGSLAVVETDDAVTVLFPVAIAEDDASSAEHDLHDFHAQALKRINLLRHLFPDKATIGSEGIGADVLSTLLPSDETVKAIPAENLPLTREIQMNVTFRNLVSYRFLRASSWHAYSDMVFSFRRAACDALHGLYRGWGRFLERQKIEAADFRRMPGPELTRLEASRIQMFPKSAVDEWGFVSEDNQDSGSRMDSEAQLRTQIWGSIRRFAAWQKLWQEYEPCISTVGQRVLDTSLVHLARKNYSETDQSDSQSGRQLLVNLASAWKALIGVQAEFRRWFAKYIPDARLAELEQHERATFSHLWPVAYAVVHSPQGGRSSAASRLEAELRAHRREFLRALKQEVVAALGQPGRADVREGPYSVSDKNCLLVICDHNGLATADTLQAEVVRAAWRATRFREWHALESTPLQMEWSHILIVHTLKGKAVSGSGAFVSTAVLFGSETEINVQPYHFITVPVDLAVLGIGTWESPVIAAALTFQARVALFTLAMLRFWSIAQATIKHGLGEATLEAPLATYSRDISNLRRRAVGAYEDLLNLLQTWPDPSARGGTDDCVARLKEASKPVLMLDREGDVTLTLDVFVEWAGHVIQHPDDVKANLLPIVDMAVEPQIS